MIYKLLFTWGHVLMLIDVPSGYIIFNLLLESSVF